MTDMTNGQYPNILSPVVGIGRAWVRPGELLVAQQIEGEVQGELTALGGVLYRPQEGDKGDFRQLPGAPAYGDINARMAKQGIGLKLWVNIPQQLQEKLANDPHMSGLVHYNHVLLGEGDQNILDFYHGGPGGPPAVQPEMNPLPLVSSSQPADIVVFDNGLPANLDTIHPQLVGRVLASSGSWPPPDAELDPLDEDHDHILDAQAGHGLFICGLIAKMATKSRILSARVLRADGAGDEALLITRLSEITSSSSARVINLSLGGYSANDRVPALAAAVDRVIDSGRVVVAAAGNAGKTPHSARPFWPAAVERVIAVGAYDAAGGRQTRWPQSNGADVYAPGVGLRSSYVQWPPPNAKGTPPFNCWATWSGTSFATAMVTANIAKWLVAVHGRTTADVRPRWLTSLSNTPTPDWPATPGKTAAAAKMYVTT